MDTISIVLPARNEASSLNTLLPEIVSLYSDAEIIVVNDGSTDNTDEVVQSCGVRLVTHPYSIGNGAAIKSGARAATGKAIIFMDADGQHDPSDIPSFLAARRATGASLIIGQRDFQQMPFSRRMANSFGRRTFSWAIGRDIPDNQSGYRSIDRQLMEALLDSSEQGFEFEVEMIVVCFRLGLELEWVPIRTIYAGEGSHINGLEHTLNFARLLYRTWRERRRAPFGGR